MAVVRLSRMTSVNFTRCTTASIRAGTPVWKKG